MIERAIILLSASIFTLVISEQFSKKYSPIFSTDDEIKIEVETEERKHDVPMVFKFSPI